MKKFTDEELSRILSAHEGVQLCKKGQAWDKHFLSFGCCLVQAAKLEPSPSAAYSMSEHIAGWFDAFYDLEWTTDELLSELEKHGVA